MRVDVDLIDKAKEIVLEEQAKYAKKGDRRGKERIVLMLLAELHDLRTRLKIAPAPMDEKQWKKYLKS